MKILKTFGLRKKNSGASFGPDWHSVTKNAGEIDSINPTTEKIIASVYQSNLQDYEIIVAKAKQAQCTWRMLPAPKRGEIIRQIGAELRRQKSMLGNLISLEMGKSKQEGDGEVQEMIDMADFALGQSRMLYGKSMHSERACHRMYEQWQPLGVVGVITAFNFPVAVWAWNAFIAAICGNTVIWKPSSKTPLCTLAVQQICNKVCAENDLSGIFSCFVSHSSELANNFVEDPRIKLISFTGSSQVGYQISQAVAKRMGKSILECSGNNAIIVDETADLDLTIPAIVFGAIGTAGQRCTSTRRVFVPENQLNKFKKSLCHAYQNLKIGDPLDPKYHMGPLIDHAAVHNFTQAIATIESLGGEIITGGKVMDRKGYFVEPTIAIANNDWPIVQEETFAPILYLIPYDDFSHAIEMQNAVNQGLSSAVFTTNLQHAEIFLSAGGSDCGIANVNIGTSGAEIGGAFGGEKSTGGGREAGSDAWKSYMRRQTVTINWGSQLPLAQGIKFDIC